MPPILYINPRGVHQNCGRPKLCGRKRQYICPATAIYLGHVDLSSTQIYLTMTPELLDATCERFEQYAFQEVSHD
jgi:integrase/recombinase XerD